MNGESAKGRTKRLRTVVFRSLVGSGHVGSRARAKELACDLEIEMIYRGATVETEAPAMAPACEVRRLRAVVLRSLVVTGHATHDRAIAMADDIAAEMFPLGATIEFEAMAG
jgi:hypothetical protein